MKKLLTVAGMLAVAGMFVAAPAFAADTTVGEKTDKAVDTTKEKTHSAMDTIKEKAKDAKEKISEKLHHGKNKAKNATGMETGSDVRAAQQALRDKGYDPGPIDGKMGPKTTTALRQYQKAENLTATGKLDAPTADKLGVTSAAASPSTTKSKY